MARISQFEHLKPDVMAEFQKGLQPKDVYAKFSQIPPKTIRNWFEAYSTPDSPSIRPQSESKSGRRFGNAHPPAGSTAKLTVVDGGESEPDDSSVSDIQWVKRTAKNIVRQEKNGAIKVQALNTYLRAIQIEAAMPVPKTELDLNELSDQELEKIAAGEDVEAIARAN